MAVVANSVILPQKPNISAVQIVNADGTAQKDLVTGDADGTKVTSIVVSSDDTVARIVQLSLLRSAVNYIIGSVSIPANSGTDGTTSNVNLLGGGSSLLIKGLPVDNDGQAYLFLRDASDKLQVKVTVAVTAAKTISVIAIHGDF